MVLISNNKHLFYAITINLRIRHKPQQLYFYLLPEKRKQLLTRFQNCYSLAILGQLFLNNLLMFLAGLRTSQVILGSILDKDLISLVIRLKTKILIVSTYIWLLNMII